MSRSCVAANYARSGTRRPAVSRTFAVHAAPRQPSTATQSPTPPSRSARGQISGHAVRQQRRPACPWIARGDVQFGPGVRRGDADGRVLPHRATGAREPPMQKQSIYTSWVIDLDVGLGLRLRAIQFGRRDIAFDQAGAVAPGVQAVAAQHPPGTIGRELEPAPQRPCQLGGDASWSKAGMAKSEGDRSLLHERSSTVTTRTFEFAVAPFTPNVGGPRLGTGTSSSRGVDLLARRGHRRRGPSMPRTATALPSA